MKSPILMAALAATIFANGAIAANDGNKGHGAGGARAEHASEQGMEKGKAWAGDRDTQAPEQRPERESADKEKRSKQQERDQKQEMEQKREKAAKQEKTKQQDKTKATKHQ